MAANRKKKKAARPGKEDAVHLVRKREPRAIRFGDDGETPNNPELPLLLYRSAVALPEDLDPAAVFENLFLAHGWRMAWRDSIYSFLHFHTRTHEVLGIARGNACVRFGGRSISPRAGSRMFLYRSGRWSMLPIVVEYSSGGIGLVPEPCNGYGYAL